MSRRRRGSVYIRGGVGPVRFYQPVSARDIGGCLGLVGYLGVIGLLVAGLGSCLSALSASKSSSPNSAAVHEIATPLESPTPSPSPSHLVFDVAGSGSGREDANSPLFTIVPGTDWDLYWSYQCVGVNPGFAVWIQVMNGDAKTLAFGDWMNPLGSVASNQGVMHAHDPNGHERVVQVSLFGPTSDHCDWKLKVVATDVAPVRPAPSALPVPSPIEGGGSSGHDRNHDWF